MHKKDFNPRPHAGDDNTRVQTSITLRKFQSTSPRGGRQFCKSYSGYEKEFQSTSPRGGRRLTDIRYLSYKDFNPRPHAGDDLVQHTPWNRLLISIHVPTRGTTLIIYMEFRCIMNFNPRPHAGDDQAYSIMDSSAFISIHVPTRGTTQANFGIYGAPQFQSTSPRGGRPVPVGAVKLVQIFQSTSPRGGRRGYPFPCPAYKTISIHVPTRGTTAKTAKIYSIYHNIFSHSYNKTKSIPQISNPTPQSHHKTPQNSSADPSAFLCSLPIRTT